MNYRLIALAISALSTAHITTANAQSVYVAPGGVYIGGGPVYVIPAPSNGNGNYVEPIYEYGNGYGYGNGGLTHHINQRWRRARTMWSGPTV